MKNLRRGLLQFLVLSLLLAACGSNTAPGGGNNGSGQDGRYNFTEEDPEENQPEGEGFEFSENEVEDPDGDSEDDSEDPGIIFYEAEDACLEGTWLLDIEIFSEGLSARLNEHLTDGSFEINPVMGELRLIFDGDFVEMRTDVPLFLKLDLTAAGILLSEMEIEVSANGTANWFAADNQILFYSQKIHVEGKGDGDWKNQIINAAGSSGKVTLDFKMSDLLVHSEKVDLSAIGLDLPASGEDIAQIYDCDETHLLLYTGEGIYDDQWFDRE